MSKKHQEVMNKIFEEVQDLIEATYRQGRTDQAVVEQGHREGSASTAKAAFARGYKKGNKHGKSQGYQLGTQDVISASKASYEEGRIAGYEEGKIDGKAVAGVVLRKAYLEGRYEGFSEGYKEGSAERAAKPELESEPASFAFLAGHTTEAEYREHRDKRVELQTSEPEPVFARAHGEPWSPQDRTEQEHATSHEADPELSKSTIELELHVDPALLQYFPFMSRLNILLPGA